MELVEEQGHEPDDRPMTSEPRPRGQPRTADPVDLLLIGGLTVDRFAHASTAPGGAVLHGATAARAAGFSVGVLTRAGEEPEAQAGLRELRELGELRSQQSRQSIWFGHEEREGTRTLTLLVGGEPLDSAAPPFPARGILYAPVAGEVPADLVRLPDDGPFTAATLQGWLRRLEPSRPVTHLALDALEPELVERLADLDLLVASEEDLAAVASDPLARLAALRATFGPHPALALTRGAHGVLIDVLGRPRLEIVPDRVAHGSSTTGAGDAFAAILTALSAAGRPLDRAAQEASNAAVAYLDRDRREGSSSNR